MATEIKSLITVCLTFNKVKVDGKWYLLTDAAVKEIEEARKHPKVWIYFLQISCRDCTLISQCLEAQ